jgi:predicted RecB family nuclease
MYHAFMTYVTASHLYNFIQCPHRVWRDTHDNPNLRDEPNDFVKLLWEKGTKYEREVIENFEGSDEIVDLSKVAVGERAAATLEAIKREEPLIYHARLEVDNLVGEPDLLERLPNGEYVPVDIKSGMGLEGQDDFEEGSYKKHYAVQLALYVDALRRMGLATHYEGRILDSSGQTILYKLDEPRGKRAKDTWWEFYEDVLSQAKNLVENLSKTKPALGSVCKLCVWYSTCKKSCVESRSLSLIPELGRSRQDSLEGLADNVDDFAALDPEDYIDAKGKVDLDGVGKASLLKFHRRAELLASGTKDPVILESFEFPERPIELYFDIEADPTQNIVYLHGVVERRMDDPENLKFHAFTAEGVSDSAEKKAWSEFWTYIRSLPVGQFSVYYYSKYERTQYRRLQKKYPDVATEDEVEAFYEDDASIDLYFDIVKKFTDWPTYNYSVKTLAQHLGFSWRDKNPSGAASIQWFNEWCEDRSDQKLQRILDYNEDDCLAMIVLKDGLEKYLT